MTTESNYLQILWQFFNQREAKPKLIALYYPTALRRVQITPRTSTISRGICTPKDQLDRFSRYAQATNWIEVRKKILFAKRTLISTFCLDRNLKVKTWIHVWFGRSKADFSSSWKVKYNSTCSRLLHQWLCTKKLCRLCFFVFAIMIVSRKV